MGVVVGRYDSSTCLIMVTTTSPGNQIEEEMALEIICFNFSEVCITLVMSHSFAHSINLNFISQDLSRISVMEKTDRLQWSLMCGLTRKL